MEINRALEVFYNGDPLNNRDLVRLRDHTLRTVELLYHLGPRFRLACNEALHISDTCTGYINARKENKGNYPKRHKQVLRSVK